MDRRAFMHWLTGTAAGVAAAHVLDVDRLLWVPGQKRIFIPPPRQLPEFLAWITIDGEKAFIVPPTWIEPISNGAILVHVPHESLKAAQGLTIYYTHPSGKHGFDCYVNRGFSAETTIPFQPSSHATLKLT